MHVGPVRFMWPGMGKSQQMKKGGYRGVNYWTFFVDGLCPDSLLLLILQMLRDLRHENVNSFVGACVEPGSVCVITEYCARGSLR